MITLVYYILIGILFVTVGTTFLNSVSEIIIALTELAKAALNEKIVKHGVKIDEMTNDKEPSRVIGFATTLEEEDDDDTLSD